MAYSESAGRLRKMIEKSIDDQKITRDEMDTILNIGELLYSQEAYGMEKY